MKRKVGELFNKPIVQGNENILASNEILVEQKGNTFSLKERVNGEIKEVSGGNNGGGSSEEKMGMVYLTKEALFQGIGAPMPDTMTQEEFKDFMWGLISTFAIVATRKDGNICDPIQAFFENATENRITFDRLDAVAINFDQLIFNKSDYGYVPMWKMFGASIEEAKAVVSQTSPNQLTEDEFFGRA